jgi:hypothetical protein
MYIIIKCRTEGFEMHLQGHSRTRMIHMSTRMLKLLRLPELQVTGIEPF